MARVKPRWAYVQSAVVTANDISEEHRERLAEIIGFGKEAADGLIYRIMQLAVRDLTELYSGPMDIPTKSELLAAAKLLKQAAGKLYAMLDKDAGGLRYPLQSKFRQWSWAESVATNHYKAMREHLEALIALAPEAAQEEAEKAPGNRPVARKNTTSGLEQFASDLAHAYQAVLEEKPTKTCDPDNPEGWSKFARLLHTSMEIFTGKRITGHQLEALVKGVQLE